MLAHAEIIVRAPDHDIARTVGGMPFGVRKAAGVALEIGKHPIAAFIPQAGQCMRKVGLVIHRSHPRWRPMLDAPWRRKTERGLRDIAVNTACLPDSMPAASLRIMTPRYDRPCRKRDGGRADECDV
jgi:hypothetical protein